MTPERWRKIEQLYHSAREREGNQRAAFLKEACAGDEALRREVESLLAQEKGAEGFLEAPALEAAAKLLVEDRGQSWVGRQLGSYQVISFLDLGGMGEVYQARDTKLGRDVALKVLPAAFVHDPDRLARFQREARMLAALNHPNIATIHGLEQSEGVHYLVMELVLGETLAERLRAGPLAVEEALRICGRIAEALEAAHEKGVMHRDLKPANVKVTSEGKIKVLDFGLAKAFAGDGGPDLSQAPTLTGTGTEEGRILGTAAYMSPEQARGKAVDKRNDIWAFGCVLYEVLTGRQAFKGETLSDTIAGVLEREPDWQALPPATPAKVRDLLRRCLRKDSQQRLRDIGDARIEIEEALAAPATAQPAAPVKEVRAGWRKPLLWGVASLVLAAIAGLAVWVLKPPAPQPVTRTVINLPPGQQLAAGLDSAIALSPDGTRLAYVASQAGAQQLYVRAMDSMEATPIPDTDGAVAPFFSPDSQWLGFFADNKLKKVSVSGGAPITLCDAPGPQHSASWGSDDTVVFHGPPNLGLFRVSAAGGAPIQVTTPDPKKGEATHLLPDLLPGGKAVLFAAGPASGNLANAMQLVVSSLQTAERRDLIAGTSPRYALTGHLVYAQGARLMAVPFYPQRLAVTGSPVPVLEGVLQSLWSGVAQCSFSRTGTLVYVPGGLQGAQRRLVWVDRKGTEQPLPAPVRAYRTPRISPDGRRVAVTSSESGDNIWLYDLARETLTRLTFEGRGNLLPIWTPDGRRIAFPQTGQPAGGTCSGNPPTAAGVRSS
jgi:hypothetical protein